MTGLSTIQKSSSTDISERKSYIFIIWLIEEEERHLRQDLSIFVDMLMIMIGNLLSHSMQMVSMISLIWTHFSKCLRVIQRHKSCMDHDLSSRLVRMSPSFVRLSSGEERYSHRWSHEHILPMHTMGIECFARKWYKKYILLWMVWSMQVNSSMRYIFRDLLYEKYQSISTMMTILSRNDSDMVELSV